MINTDMLYDLYSYIPGYDLLFDNGRFTCANNLTDSRPMNNNLIKLHKGVDNVARFRVFDSNRKRTSIDNFRIKVSLIDKETRQRVLSVYGDHDCEKGIFYVTITEGLLFPLATGFYDVSITGEEFVIPEQPGEIASTPFYTNYRSDIHFEAEITDNVDRTPIPTVDIEEWSNMQYTLDGVNTGVMYSSSIPANRLKNTMGGTHTFTVKAEHFRGKVYVCGTLNHTPPSPSNMEMYFPVDVENGSNVIQFGEDEGGSFGVFSGIKSWTFQANVMWLVFYWITTDSVGVPTPMTVDPIIILPNTTEVVNKLERIQIRS